MSPLDITDTNGPTAHQPSSSVSIATPAANNEREASQAPNAISPDKDAKNEKSQETATQGSVTQCKTLFAKYDKEGNRSWSVSPPDTLEDPAENDDTRKYAVLVRKLAPKEADSSKPLIIDSLIIQSPSLKSALAKILKDYPGIVIDVGRLVLNAPFEGFVHRWDDLVRTLEDPANDGLTREHLKLLHDILENDLREILQSRKDSLKTETVSWENAWTIFPPGGVVWGSKYGKPLAMKFISGKYGENKCGKFYKLTCECIEWDGKLAGWSQIDQKISEYPGTIPCVKLSCYPLDMHPEVSSATQMLQERGRRFQELAGLKYTMYKGMSMWFEWERDTIRQELVESRIVIDAAGWAQYTPALSFTTSKNPSNAIKEKAGPRVDGGNRAFFAMFGEVAPRRGDDDSSDNGIEDSTIDKETRQVIAEDDLIFTSPIVRGYSLTNAKWMEFFLENVSDIQFRESPFDSLVLSEDKKEVILAFAQSQVKHKDRFDDFISGKGRGIVMLLTGGPGIGKTLTAESVAEEMRVPLYSISASHLGNQSYLMEMKLRKILNIVAKWNAVLLLDECDVYLEERSKKDVERNAIVSVFLRALEYYQGILFLTTNRVETIDPAFKSRIHLTLQYPSLEDDAREKVWRAFLNRQTNQEGGGANDPEPHNIRDEDISTLGKMDMNGREIKNTLKMANLLAWQKEESLSMAHIQKVLMVQGVIKPRSA